MLPGKNIGEYLVSKDGKRDGENLWNLKDQNGEYIIRKHIQISRSLKPGEVHIEQFEWKNSDQEQLRNRTSAICYFEPWHWHIAASSYDEDFYNTKNKLQEVIDSLQSKHIWVDVAALLFAFILAFFLAGRLTKPLKLIRNLVHKIANGQLKDAQHIIENVKKINSENNNKLFTNHDETSDLLHSIRIMITKLISLIGQVQQSGIQVTTSATEISASARQLEATVAEQAATTINISDTTQTISATSEDLVNTMSAVSMAVNQTASLAQTGHQNLSSMHMAMEALMNATESISSKLSVINDKASKISSVVVTINKISDQTNLLSLNAAIEAEKAGEYGRGFSVVAREISRLADQTAVATQDIEHMVSEMQDSVSSGVMEMDKFSTEVRDGASEVDGIGNHLSNIIQQVNQLSPQFSIAESGMKSQSASAQNISESMSQLAIAVEQTKDSLGEFKKATEQLNSAVIGLKKEVSLFKV